MLRILSGWMILFCSFGCGPAEDSSSGAPEKVQPEDENALLLRLSGDLIFQPQSLEQQEENQILNYAIENLLDVERTNSGMYFLILYPGKGSQPKLTSTVEVHYAGRMLNGKVFDSSYARGHPQRFGLSSVITGWQQAVSMLRPGGRGLFLLPSRLAYGKEGLGDIIPPNTVLQFEIELVKVE